MFRPAIVALGIAAASCAGKPITSDEFVPHGRFQAEDGERALAQCRYEAGVHQQEVQAAMRARRDVLGGAIEGSHARMLAIQSCMEARGYTWSNPRWGL